MDPDLVLTNNEKTVRFRKCLKRFNNWKKTKDKLDGDQHNQNVSLNVKERLTLYLNTMSSKKGI